LAQLYDILPKEIELSNIRFEEAGKFSLRGSAVSMSVVFSLVDNLEKSNYFKEVKTRYTTKRKTPSGDVTDFEIVCNLEKPS
jgi:Tfp pilus assembly protein PilN